MKDKKGLQRFTNFGSIKTQKQFLDFVTEYPEKRDDFKNYIVKKLNGLLRAETKEEGEIDRCFNRIIKICEVQKDMTGVKSMRRDRWCVNESLINAYINNQLVKTRTVPSITDIAVATGISRITVQKHIKERKTSEYYAEQTETLKGLTHSVLAQLYKIGLYDSNVKALKVFLDYFKESPSPQQGTQINTQNNFIQINGLTISQEQITKLTPEQLTQVERLLNNV